MPKKKFIDIPEPPTTLLPKWATHQYAGEESDMVNDIYAAVFWRDVAALKLAGKSKPADVESPDWYFQVLKAAEDDGERRMLTSRLTADAMLAALQKIDGVREKSQRGFLRLLWELKLGDRYLQGASEYGSLQEMLIDRVARFGAQDKPNKSELYDVLFFVEELMPIFAELGIDDLSAEALLAFKDNYSKARAAVPYLRNAVSELQAASTVFEKPLRKLTKTKMKAQKDMAQLPPESPRRKKTEQEIKEIEENIAKMQAEQVATKKAAEKVYVKKIKNVVHVVTDSSVSMSTDLHSPNSVGSLLRNDNEKQTFVGREANVDDRVVFFLSVPARFEKAVTSGLKSFVEFKLTDPVVMRKDVEKALSKDYDD